MGIFHQECLICGSPKLKSLPKFHPNHLLKCKSCGFVFMEQIPSKLQLDTNY